MNLAHLKGKLDTGFGRCIEEAHKLRTDMMSGKHKRVNMLEKLLTLIGEGCGYCLVQG